MSLRKASSARDHFPRKFERILSANQTTKIAANARTKYRAVHKSALAAFVMASSLASDIDLLPERIMAAATSRFAQDQFCRAAAKWPASLHSEVTMELCPGMKEPLQHDPDPKGRVSAKCAAVFRKDHAQTTS
ncbi:hypothetical protein [Bradyrhizobium sp. USDA 4486]